MNLVGLIVVGVGGALGAVTRALITEVIDRRVMTWFPVATFLINIVSCFIMGCIMQLVSSELLFDILGMGFLGGFSTLSSMNHQAYTLMKRGHSVKGLSYMFGSYVICFGAAVAGYMLFSR